MSTKSSSSSKKPADKQSQKLKVWNQCSGCRLVIQKLANDDHVCQGADSEQSLLFDGQLIGASFVEHDKGEQRV